MNILEIGELYDYGGATEIMELLGKELEKRGHNLFYIFGYNPKDSEVKPHHYVLFQKKFLRKINNRFKKTLEKYNISNLYAKIYIKKIVKRNKIDVIHFHSMQGAFLTLRDIEYLVNHYHVVWTVHDTWPFTGGCMYYNKCEQWKNEGCIECADYNLQIYTKDTALHYKRKKKALLNKKITFTCPSEWMMKNIYSSFLKTENIVLIPNGIDLDIFKPVNNIDELKEKYKIPKHKKVLMFSAASINNPYKGWKYLYESLQNIKDKEDFFLIIVGGTDDVVQDIHIENLQMGFVQNKKILNECYNMADVFLVPSVQDNFPTVILEAQATGTPVIAFNTGGIKEQISEHSGWVLDEISSKAINNTLCVIFDKADWKNRLSQKGIKARERCESLYTKEIMASNYLDVYMKWEK